MKSIIVSLLSLLLCINAYAENVNADVHGQNADGNWVAIGVDSNGALRVNSTINETETPVGTPSFTPAEIVHSQKSYANKELLSEYRVKYANFAISGGNGTGSGGAYVPELGLWLLMDNNDTEINVYQEDDLATLYGTWDLDNLTGGSGTGDPEWVSFVGNIKDTTGAITHTLIAFGEESCSVAQGCPAGSQRFYVCSVPNVSGNQDINATNTSQCTEYEPTGMWSNETGFGWEAGRYDPIRKGFHAFKQGNNAGIALEYRFIDFSDPTNRTPAATEPWDAETILAANIASVNDVELDLTTGDLIIICDEQGADSNNQDLLRLNQYTGAILEELNAYTDTYGFNIDTRTDWPQGEAIAVTPDMKRMMLGSETDNAAWLERPPLNSNYSEYWFGPSDAVLDDTVPPGAVAIVESTGTGTSRFNTLQFDATTDEICYFTFVVPQEFRVAGNVILLDIYWYANSVTAAADAIWAAQVSATTAGDADTPLEQAATAANTVATVTNLTEANRLNLSTISLTIDDSIAAGDLATIVFFRDADDSVGNADNDGLAVDANVISWRLRIPRR